MTPSTLLQIEVLRLQLGADLRRSLVTACEALATRLGFLRGDGCGN